MGEGAGSETAAMVTISNTIVKAGAAGLNIANFSGTFAISNTSLKATGALGGNIYNSNGAINSLGYNLSSDAAGGDGTTVPGGFLDKPGDIRNTEPSLGLLKDNGGPTFTHELLAGSPAIDAGDPNFTPPPDFDQRGTGYPRVVNGRIDIGAFEVQTAPACPQPKGYWKSNPALSPVTSLTLGSQTYSKTQLLTILKMAVGTGPKADASLILADQLIAAKLNIANGSDPTPIDSTITHADSLLSALSGKLPYKIRTNSTNGKMMVSDGNALNNYNNGLLTPVCTP